MYHGKNLCFVLLSISISLTCAQQEQQNVICNLSGGNFNEIGECIVCLDDQRERNCCVFDLTTFGLVCDQYCTNIIQVDVDINTNDNNGNHSLSQPTSEFCGPASCSGSVSGSTCSSLIENISFSNSANATPINNVLSLDWVCDQSRTCTCNQATWNGENCTNCMYTWGVGESYDCTNVGGPVGVTTAGGSNSTTGENSDGGTSNLPRPYRTNEVFLAEVVKLTLTEASRLAGVPIGAAIPDTAVNDDQRESVKNLMRGTYNMIVAENAMKWNRLLSDPNDLSSYDFTTADAIVEYSTFFSYPFQVRGHTLIWGKSKGTTYPEAVATTVMASDDPNATIIEIMERHITAVASHFYDQVDAWDVVNEHLTSRTEENIFYTTLGDDYVKIAFQLAREVLPQSVRLVWNEALGSFNLNDPSIRQWLETLRQYKLEGIPVDTIAVQGHNIQRLHNITELAIFFRTVVDIGYDIELSEIDAPISLFLDNNKDGNGQYDPFEEQGEFFKEYILTCLNNTRKCKGITFWGLTDNHTWYDSFFIDTKPNLPLLIDEEGYRKPAWLAVRQAYEQSSMSNVTDDNYKDDNDKDDNNKDDHGDDNEQDDDGDDNHIDEKGDDNDIDGKGDDIDIDDNGDDLASSSSSSSLLLVVAEQRWTALFFSLFLALIN